MNTLFEGSKESDMKVRSILLLDDNEHVLRILTRYLKRRFDAIFTATDPKDAEMILEQHEISTVVCDHGVANPSSTELISKWRKKYASIGRAVILTGANIEEVEPSPEVDSVLSKSFAMSDILAEVGK